MVWTYHTGHTIVLTIVWLDIKSNCMVGLAPVHPDLTSPTRPGAFRKSMMPKANNQPWIDTKERLVEGKVDHH